MINKLRSCSENLANALTCRVFILTSCFVLYVVYVGSFHRDQQIVFFRLEDNVPSGKLILYWTNFFQYPDYEVGFGDMPFADCPVANCLTTRNRSLLNESDVIVFHMRDIRLNDMPKHRLPHQRWVFYLLESPHHSPNIKNLENVFNWTMTYRMDSDVFLPYGLRKEAMADRIYNETLEKEAGSFNQRLSTLISGKNKTVAWVVSNCGAPSGRNKYVDELKKYIDVDIFGGCGTPCPGRKECFEKLERSYKFYLSFENSLCRDYVTEKFLNPLIYTMVPIVYGSANYSAWLPELNSSYIDVRNFSSVQALADYLHYLDKYDEAYKKYFEWRQKPAGLSVIPRITTGWCTLCQMLADPSLPSFTSHNDVNSWWFDEAECGKEKHLFENQLKSVNASSSS